MPTYTAPGVYVEEVASSQKVLSPAATAIAAFVGFTERAPNDDPADPEGLAPRLVTSWSQYEQLYGGFAPGCMMPLSVYGYRALPSSRSHTRTAGHEAAFAAHWHEPTVWNGF